MPEAAANNQTEQVLKFMVSVMHYRRYVMNKLPDNLARQKEKIEKLYLADGPRRPHDHDLFYRIGMVLTHSPEPPPMGELSKALDVPLSTATRIVDGLVEAGFAERVNDPADRRIVRVNLTDDGRLIYGAMYSYIRESIDEALRSLDEEERVQLTDLLGKLADNLEKIAK